MKDAKEAAATKINEFINNESNEVTAKIKEFLGIDEEIDVQNGALDTIRNALEAKKVEIQTQIENAAKEKVDEAKEQAKEEINKQTEAAKNKATDAIKSGASNFLKGFKR